VNEALVDTSAPRLAGIVGLVDRLFPILWIGLYLLLPVSGWATVMFTSWADQRRDLGALRSLLETGGADAIASSGIGPAYIGAAALLHELFGLSPEDSLIALTRASYVLSVAAGLVLVRVLVVRLARVPPVVSLASQIGFAALVFAAGTWYWSDVPWSHFFAMFLAVALFAVRFAPDRPTALQAAVAGALLALLGATRSFELVALVLAWAIAAVGLAALRISAPQERLFRRTAVGACALLVTTVAVSLATGKRDLFFLYSGSLDRQAGNVTGAEVAETPTLSLSLIPVKLVQLFVEPCYYSLCRVSDYVGPVAGLAPDLDAGNYRLWRQPLAIQLPSLVLLPLCLLAMAWIVVWAVRHRAAAREELRAIRLVAELTIAATGIVVGYAASTLTGAPHLRYGFARDLLLPALLTAIVATALASALFWWLLTRRSARFSPEIKFIAATAFAAVIVVGGTAYARTAELPRIESRQLGAVSYTANCSGARCDVRLEATTPGGAKVSIPEASTLTFGCGSDRPAFTLYVEQPTAGVAISRPCTAPRLVAAWPTVMGLPPGSFELAAVTVRNA
jgi:hypothetical protein